MPFIKINVKQIVDEKKEMNPKFAKTYNEIEKEYELIRKIVRVRKEKNLTQRELARKVGVQQQVISRFEREKHIPTLTGFLKILNGLGLDIDLVEKDSYQQEPNDGLRHSTK